MKSFLLILLVFITFSLFCENNDKIIISAHPDYPPFMWQENGIMVGVSVKLVEEIFSELDYDYEIKYVGPWQRVQEYAKIGNIDVICGLYKNKDRESYLYFSDSYISDPNSVFVKKGKEFDFCKKEDLIGRKGVTIHGDSFGEEMDRFIDNELHVMRVLEPEVIYRKLIEEKIDYGIWGYYPAQINANLFNYSDQILFLNTNITEQKLYLAFSNKSKFKNIIEQVNIKIEEFKKSGKIEQWVNEYIKKYSLQAKIN